MKLLRLMISLLTVAFMTVGCGALFQKPPTVDLSYNPETHMVRYIRSGEQKLQGLKIRTFEDGVDVTLEAQQTKDAVNLEAMKAVNALLNGNEKVISRVTEQVIK